MKWYQALSLGALFAIEAAALSIPYSAPKPAKPAVRSEQKYEKPAYDPYEIRQKIRVDIDGDGFHDIISMNGVGQIYAEKGLGSGRFGRVKKIGQPFGPGFFYITDKDNDGDPDIVVTKFFEELGMIRNDNKRLEPFTGFEPEKEQQ